MSKVPHLGEIAENIVKRLRERNEATGEFVLSDAQADFAVRLHLATLQMDTMEILEEGKIGDADGDVETFSIVRLPE